MRMQRALLTVAALIFVAVLPAAAQSAAPATPVAAGRMVRPLLITHVVASLEKSVAFYLEGLDLEVVEGPAPLTASALVQKAVAMNPAARARAATLRIPGSQLSLQLVEFSGIPGKAFTQRLYDPGITRFSIQVRDIDKAFDKVKDKVTVDTTSAGPVYTQRPRNNTRAVMMRDPDGFVFEFVQAGTIPETPGVPVTSNIYNARSSLAIDSFDKALPFYRDLLGFTLNNPPNDINDAVLALEGTPRANARTAGSMPPGSNNMWVLWEFRDIERTKHSPNPQDPGASSISLQVENLSALLGRMRAGGVAVEWSGDRRALVRSPDGLLVELVE